MVGLDFGTSNTVASLKINNSIELIPLENQGLSTPTIIYLDNKDQVKIGTEAKEAYRENLKNSLNPILAANSFRLIQAVKLALKDKNLKSTNIFGKQVSIETIVSLFLQEVRKKISPFGGPNQNKIVVGRPVELGVGREEDRYLQNRFTTAFKMAGFSEVSYIYEPVAAAAGLVGKVKGKVLIFDFGGGTLDLSIAQLNTDTIEIIGTSGLELGGFHLDEEIAKSKVRAHFGHGSKYKNISGRYLEVPHFITDQVTSYKPLPLDQIQDAKRTIADLLYEASDKNKLLWLKTFLEKGYSFDLYSSIDRTKINLSQNEMAELNFLMPDCLRISETLYRGEFEKVIVPKLILVEKLITTILEKSHLKERDIDFVVRVGGSSLIPAFKNLLESKFPTRVLEGNIFNGICLGLLPAFENGFVV